MTCPTLSIYFRPESYQPRHYIEPITTSGNRDDVETRYKDTSTLHKEHQMAAKSKGKKIPGIDKIPIKRRLKNVKKKYKYNLEVTPAEKLFGPNSYPSLPADPIKTTDLHGYDLLSDQKQFADDSRPKSRLFNYTDVKLKPTHLKGSRNMENQTGTDTVDDGMANANTMYNGPAHSHIVPPRPPSSLLLQIARGPQPSQTCSSMRFVQQDHP